MQKININNLHNSPKYIWGGGKSPLVIIGEIYNE